MQSIHGLAIHSPESNKSSRLEFDGIGTVANAKHPWLGYTQSWIQQKQPVGVWWNWYSSKCKASMAWLYTVLNPTKAAGWSLMELVTVANAKYPWLGYTQSWIQQKQPVDFDGFGTVANAKASMAWLYTVLNPTKAAGWSLMDLVQ